MPMYDVEHICQLSDSQKDQIAEAITQIHSDLFTTPRLFVNVNFKDINYMPTYVAGKRRANNRIMANVRTGPGRTQEMFNDLCNKVNAEWKSIVGSKGDDELRAIFVLGTIIAGSEAGFSIPAAGEDAAWLKRHVADFQKLADGGDTDFQDLMVDLRNRDAFKNVVNGALPNGS